MSHFHTPSSRALKWSCVFFQELQNPPPYLPKAPQIPLPELWHMPTSTTSTEKELGPHSFRVASTVFTTSSPRSLGEAHGFKEEGVARNKGEESLPHKRERKLSPRTNVCCNCDLKRSLCSDSSNMQ